MSSASSARESIPWTKRSISELGAIDGCDSGISAQRDLLGIGPSGMCIGTLIGVPVGAAIGAAENVEPADTLGATAESGVEFENTCAIVGDDIARQVSVSTSSTRLDIFM